jgi:hypothetical protein
VSLEATVDTGGAVSIASRHLLSNIKPAKKRGNSSCQMVTVNGLTPPYTHQRELHFTDEAGLPIVILCYAQHGPVLGHKDFVLIANSTVVAMDGMRHKLPRKILWQRRCSPIEENFVGTISLFRLDQKDSSQTQTGRTPNHHRPTTHKRHWRRLYMSSQTRAPTTRSRLPTHHGQETEKTTERSIQPEEGSAETKRN